MRFFQGAAGILIVAGLLLGCAEREGVCVSDGEPCIVTIRGTTYHFPVEFDVTVVDADRFHPDGPYLRFKTLDKQLMIEHDPKL